MTHFLLKTTSSLIVKATDSIKLAVTDGELKTSLVLTYLTLTYKSILTRDVRRITAAAFAVAMMHGEKKPAVRRAESISEETWRRRLHYNKLFGALQHTSAHTGSSYAVLQRYNFPTSCRSVFFKRRRVHDVSRIADFRHPVRAFQYLYFAY